MLFYFVQITYNFNYKTIKFTILVVILFYLHFGPPPPSPDLFTMQRNSRVSPPIPFFPSLPNGKMDKNSPLKKKKKNNAIHPSIIFRIRVSLMRVFSSPSNGG